MAKVMKVGDQYCVVHDITGQVLKRKGRRVCFPTKREAATDARATRKRVIRKAGKKVRRKT